MVTLLTGIGLIFQFPATRFIDILYGVNMTNIDDALAKLRSFFSSLLEKYRDTIEAKSTICTFIAPPIKKGVFR